LTQDAALNERFRREMAADAIRSIHPSIVASSI